MKSFFQFLNEAESQASMQAKKLNLKSDGHGSWMDTRGNIVATTDKGKLVFIDKKKAKRKMINHSRQEVQQLLKQKLKRVRLKLIRRKKQQLQTRQIRVHRNNQKF